MTAKYNIVGDLLPLAVSVEELKFDEKNARIHDERNLLAIRNSLDRFGQRKPIVALEDGTVIAGNGTLESAKQLGWTHLAVVRVRDDAATAAAFSIADNRTAELAKWDDEKLAELVKELAQAEIVNGENLLDATGFSKFVLKDLLSEEMPAALPEQQFLIVIDCTNETEQRQLFERMTAEGFKCTIM